MLLEETNDHSKINLLGMSLKENLEDIKVLDAEIIDTCQG